MQNFLLIKLGALGDCVQACGHVRSLKNAYPECNITVLTRPAFVKFWQLNPYVNAVIASTGCDGNAIQAVRNSTQIVDLQNSDKTAALALLNFTIFKRKWAGSTFFAKHRVQPDYTTQQAFYADAEIFAGVLNNPVMPDNLDWLKSSSPAAELPKKYALIVPGCAPQHPYKRWAPENYGAVAKFLFAQGIVPVLIGAKAEKVAIDVILNIEPACLNLAEKTQLSDLPDLARGAVCAVGNDTGPMHFIGVTGCKTLVLFGDRSNPVRHKPLGENVFVLQEKPISGLDFARVQAKISEFL